MAQVAKALKKDLENTTVSNPVEAVVSCDCGNKKQCWDPCGESGKSGEHAAKINCPHHAERVKNIITAQSN